MAAALVVLAIGVAGSAMAASPSFSCSAAKAPIEKVICSDDTLARHDAEMAAAYQALRQTLDAKGRADLLQQQRLWLQSRFTACAIPVKEMVAIDAVAPIVTCLDKLYLTRTAELSAAKTAQAAMQAKVGALANSTEPTVTGAPELSGQAGVTAIEAANTAAKLDRTVFPATGHQQTILSIGQFGRYALTSHSAQGTALQLVSRMTGPGEFSGVAGSSDGRLDQFLDRGIYKIVLQSSDKGSGETELDLHPFVELNAPGAPRLTDLKLVQSDLDDFQQRSYWLEIKERRVVAIEAAGRNLADLRLWRDGNWLVDATPEPATSEPQPGKPLAVQHLVATLEPGLYLLSAYGGPTLPWAKSSDAHPFYLHMGIPAIAEGGRLGHIASPFGVDRFLVPASANYFRLELPEAETADIAVSDYKEAAPFAVGERVGITKKTQPPVAEINNSSESGGVKLITITREAGKPYVLQHFKSVRDYPFKVGGAYWISTLHSGYGDDNVDATAVLVEHPIDGHDRIIESTVPELTAGTRWTRRFNLLDTGTIYFHVMAAGSYQIEANAAGQGAEAEYRFEPMLEFPSNYTAPDFQPAGQPWKLEPGYYVLTMRPKDKGKGILTLTVRGATAPAGPAPAEDQQKVTSITWPHQALSDALSYTIDVNRQPGVQVGVVLRSLPIDLKDDLPLTLAAHQSLDVPVTATVGDTITAIAETGQPVAFTLDHGGPVTAWIATGGEHQISLRNDGDKPIALSLHQTPVDLAPETPLPAISAEALAQIPIFPALQANEPAYFDIAKDEKRTFAVPVREPGLYRLETSGLLQTEGAIRTRTVVALDRQANNGTGRNFLIQQYLGEGEYQLTVNAQGQTQGHLGLTLTPTTLDDVGLLSLQHPARHSLTAGHGLLYTFVIPSAGRYHLRANGLNRQVTMRLEDADGWPLIAPGAPADLTYDFTPGTYHLIVLPQPVDAKTVTVIDPLPPEPILTGHGPHDLALNRSQAFQWLEPATGQPRSPDLWRFTLPARSTVSIALPRGLLGRLHALPAATGDLPAINGGEDWSHDLPAGQYQLEVTSRTPNNRLDYTVGVSTTELVAGEHRDIDVPADVPVALGGDTVVEISSLGDQDVRAWLYDDANTLVATNDDRADDWNFAIAGRLKAGKYRLHVEPVGAAGGRTTVQVMQSAERVEPTLAIGQDRELAGADGHLLPLAVAAAQPGVAPTLLVISVLAPDTVTGLSLERRQGNTWQTVGETNSTSPWLITPLVAATAASDEPSYRLRVWSADRTPAAVTVQTRLVPVTLANQQEFIAPGGTGVTLVPVGGLAQPLAVAGVSLASPASFQLQQGPADLRVSSGDDARSLKPIGGGVLFGTGKTVLLAARLPAPDAQSRIAVSPIIPSAKELALTLPADGTATSIVDRDLGGGHPILWLAESRLGQPGITLDRDLATPRQHLFGLSVADQSSVAVSIEQGRNNPIVKLWNSARLGEALPLSLRRFDFQGPKVEPIGWVTRDVVLGAGQASTLKAPKGLKRLQLTLPPQVAAVISRQGKRLDVIWSGNQGRAITLESDADQVTLLSVATVESHAGISLVQLSAKDALPILGGGHVVKQYVASAGTLRLALHLSDAESRQVAAGQQLHLRVAGAVTQTSFLDTNGRLSGGEAAGEMLIPVSADGVVELEHQAGLVVAWVEGGDSLAVVGKDRRLTTISSPSVVPLAGPGQSLKVTVAQPTFLHLATSVPVLANVAAVGSAGRLQVFPNGADLSLYLPAGDSIIELQAADAGSLSGSATITMTDIVPIGEGLGPRQRLAPGDSRLFSFVVPDERDIGVGVRGSADIAHCRLLDANGIELGAGVVQMQHLQKGTYLLAVDVPADGTSIEVQPALVGIAKPDGSPPDDVKREYLSLAGLKPKQQE